MSLLRLSYHCHRHLPHGRGPPPPEDVPRRLCEAGRLTAPSRVLRDACVEEDDEHPSLALRDGVARVAYAGRVGPSHGLSAAADHPRALKQRATATVFVLVREGNIERD